tara:strand:- start:203 stop:1009 length:807 start_codon:yes stop_codon:yes gene_type:complete
MDHFYRYKYSNIELEILGAFITKINLISSGNPVSLCDIWCSEINLQSVDHSRRDIINLEDSSPIKIIDRYGFFRYSSDKKNPSLIVINEYKLKQHTVGEIKHRNYLRTVVLIHEIGHWIEYCVSFNLKRKNPIIRSNFSSNNSEFHELWAQIFTYKCLSDSDLLNSLSPTAQDYIAECKEVMLKLSEGQSHKYRTFKFILNDERASLDLIENCSFNYLFRFLERIRNKKRNYFQEFNRLMPVMDRMFMREDFGKDNRTSDKFKRQDCL